MTGTGEKPVTLPERKKRGRLFIVATPIGNLQDLSFRALEILKAVPVIACEDTRQTLKLLNRYGLKKRLISYFQPKEKIKIPSIMRHLEEGRDVALVSDAGTPGISDPGFSLVRKAIENKISVCPVPGASAITAALSASGLPTHRFVFLGFPPPRKTALQKLFQSLAEETATLVFYVPGRKITQFVELAGHILGKRRIVIARELTKIHEEFIRGTPEEILALLIPSQLKGEATVLIEGKSRKAHLSF